MSADGAAEGSTMGSHARLTALLRKELLDLRANRAVLLPVVASSVGLLLPFVVALAVPRLSGRRLGDDADLQRALDSFGAAALVPSGLSPEALAQAFVFQQFLLFLLLLPVVGVMALASHSLVGEKQARSLEPLLATPLTTAELLVAKGLAAALPAFAIEAAAFLLYMAGIAWLAEPGVARAVLSTRTIVLVGLVGPLATLVALQLAVLVSSRVNDPRTAQQVGVLVVLPLVGLFVAQIAGLFWLTTGHLLLLTAGLAAIWLGLVATSVVVFDRDRMLTR
jgi:ABC-2 type transport system permease protein